MSTAKNSKPTLILSMALVVAAAGAGFFVMLASAPQEHVEVQAQVAAPAVEQPAAATPVERRDPSAEPNAAAATNQAGDEPKPKLNRLAADREREQIWSALGRKHSLKPAVPGSAAPSEAAATLLPSLDREYVRGAIKEQLVPVAVDCYNTVLSQDAKAGGRLVFNFTIIGDEEIGGVVESVELGEDSTFDNEFLRECLSESLLAVTFPPPPDGGRVEVSYPLTFEPGDEEDE